ncbi:putative zinc metalloprotease [Schizophyllum commune]
MGVVDYLVAAISFRTLPTTFVAVLVYLAIFISVLVTDELPATPKDQRGLNLTQAYSDLRQIAARPHPYNSHANDLVHDFILARLKDVTASYDYAHIIDDKVSNGSWSSRNNSVYFEGTNILVKIDGHDADKSGALFSAHYDSVSTAPGATDDGMGVATLLQLVEYYAKHRPQRTAVFNINNGEEDWLNGAHAFLEHPWSNLTDTFLNLEGASSGGRPLLFRATATAPVRAFREKYVTHPHGNVLSSDAFARGVVRSGTDYSVYVDGRGMDGADLAFYKGRSRYHTKYDAVQYTDGGVSSLWAMMEAAQGVSGALLSSEAVHGDKGGAPVYFDLFGQALIVFPLSAMITFNIVFLVVGPVVLALLVAFDVVARQRRQEMLGGGYEEQGFFARAWMSFKSFRWVGGFWKHAKFWVSLAVTVGLQVLLCVGYLYINPLIAYSSSHIVLLSFLSLAYLSTYLVHNIPSPTDTYGSHLPEQQKQAALLQLYFFTWILLLAATILGAKLSIGSFYILSLWNAVLFAACAIGSIAGLLSNQTAEGDAGYGVRRRIRGVRYDREGEEEGVESETAPTEVTPLIAQPITVASPDGKEGEEVSGAIGWWFIQFVLSVPAVVILVSQLALLMLAATEQTLADGSPAVTVYGCASLMSVLAILPLAPFACKLHRRIAYVATFVLVASTAYTWLVFPFSERAPLKVFFQQQVDLDANVTETRITGHPAYLRQVIAALPSAGGASLNCTADDAKAGLQTCGWTPPSALEPGVISLDFNASRTGGQNQGRFEIVGTDTRACRVYFDKSVTRFQVHGGTEGVQKGFEIPEEGVRELRLWSRTWNRTWVVDVDREGSTLTGRVACEWSEYASGSLGVETRTRIPAYEEVLTFLPSWAVASKFADGLVEGYKAFEV